MPGHTRSIYSRRQRLGPDRFDNPLADFLDRLPDYFNDYQRNQLALERQQLADKRYEDSQRIAKEQREKEQIRYNKAQQDKEDAEKKGDYRRIIDALPEYDFEGKSRAARQFNYEDQAQFFDAQDEAQSSSLSEVRSKVSQVQNLGPNATFYDYDKIKISPDQISMLKERDSFAYDTLVKAKGRFDNQRETGMRAMSREDQNRLKGNLANIANIERQMIEAAQKIPSIDTDNKTAQEILNNLKKTGIDPEGNLRNLREQLNNYQRGVDALYSKYRITAPAIQNQEFRTGETETGETMTDLKSIASNLNIIPSMPTLASGASSFTFDSKGEALDQNELIGAQYTLATEPEDSQEYKNAVELLSQQYEGATNVLDQGRDIDITTSRPLPGISGLTERLSIAGQQIQEGEREDSGFRINPNARAFSLPPEGKDNPEYYDRVARQFEIEAGKLSTLTLNPEQYEGAGRRGVTQKMVELNNALRTRDNLVSQVKDLYRQIPKTKKFSKQIKMFKDIIEDNPTGLQVTLDREARGGKGAFKFNKNKLSKEYRQLLADVNEQLKIDEDQQPTQNLIQRLVNQSGALANPTVTPQPIQLFE
jgi:hypothetical protein